jgi:hypothetical protein
LAPSFRDHVERAGTGTPPVPGGSGNAHIDRQHPRTSIERITPTRARELLAKKRPNARANASAVKTYSEAMKNGEWIFNGMPIIFSQQGTLIDGLARLAACVDSGAPFLTVVAENIDEAVLHTIDQQRRRSYAGVLESRGEPHAATLQATIAKLCRIEDCEIASNSGSDAILVMSIQPPPITRAWSKSSFPRPYIWRFTSLSLVIWPSV